MVKHELRLHVDLQSLQVFWSSELVHQESVFRSSALDLYIVTFRTRKSSESFLHLVFRTFRLQNLSHSRLSALRFSRRLSLQKLRYLQSLNHFQNSIHKSIATAISASLDLSDNDQILNQLHLLQLMSHIVTCIFIIKARLNVVC